MVYKKSFTLYLLLSTLALTALSYEHSESAVFKNKVTSGSHLGDYKPDFYDNFTLYATNFLNGAKVIKNIPNTVECVNATRDTSRIIINSINKIKEKGLSFETYLAHTEAISTAQPTIEACFEPNYKQITMTSHWLKHFKSTLSFVEKLFLNGLYSFYHWFEISTAFIDALAKQDIPRLAYISGKATFVLFDFDSDLKAPANVDFDQEQLTKNAFSVIFDLVYNFLDGALIFESYHVEFCEGNLTDYKTTFEHAREEISQGTAESIEKGVFEIAGLVGEYNNLNQICSQGVFSAIDRVHEYMRIRKAPLEIIYNFVWNYKKVYKHMTQSVECIFSGDAKCVGFHSGKLFYEIFAKH